MPEPCGKKYEHLLVTAEGRTLEDPCAKVPGTDFCFISGYDPWYDVVANVAAQVKRRYQQAKQSPKVMIPAELEQRTKAFFEAFDELPTTTWAAWSFSDMDLISQAAPVAREGTCLMELFDGVIEAAGETPVPVPGGSSPAKRDEAKTDIGSILQNAVLLLILGGVVYVIVKSNAGEST